MEEILEALVVGEANDNDVEDAILYHILNNGENAIINRGNRLNLNDLPPKDVKLNFRFEKDDIERLTTVLRIPNFIRTETRHVATGVEGLCILLRRLAYPNRLYDLENLFGLSSQSLSQIANYMTNFIYEHHGHLLNDINNLRWLNREKLQHYAEAITAKGAPVQNCWGFIDGTARAICRPSINQEEYYSGHKRFHCVKYQSVICPDGVVVSLLGAYPGRRHDSGIFRESQLYQQLERCTVFPNGEKYVLYGDQAYGIRELLLCPYPNRGITREQQNFNTAMSASRQAVEWGFQKIIAEFAFVDFRKNQRLLLQDVEQMYITAMILTNCHTCLYGSQTAEYFQTVPPQLEEYIGQ